MLAATATARLAEAGVPSARFDAEALLAEDLGHELGALHLAQRLVQRVGQVPVAHGAALAAEFGGLDGIINNAGLSVVAPFADCPRADFDRVMAVNFDAVVEGCRVALPHVRARAAGGKPGWIVNISSVFGLMGYPTQSAYNASKFAVRGLTEALYLELAVTDPSINVIRVHPGGIKTNVARNAKVIATMPGAPQGLDNGEEFEKAARTTPEQAAETIIQGMERGQHRVLIGPDARFIDWVVQLFPVSYWKRIGAFLGGAARKD